MAVLKDKDNKKLIVTCNCGCSSALNITMGEIREKRKVGSNTKEYWIDFSQSLFYSSTEGVFDKLKIKLKKIWKIIRNKDHSVCDIIVTEDEIKEINEFIQASVNNKDSNKPLYEIADEMINEAIKNKNTPK